jgi:hypothetical protein
MKAAAKEMSKVLTSFETKPFAEFYRWLFDFYKGTNTTGSKQLGNNVFE